MAPELTRSRHGVRVATVREAMVRRPKTLPVDVTVSEASTAFAGGHVHLLLLIDGHTLVGTLLASDLPPHASGSAAGAAPALRHATLRGRTVSPDVPAAEIEAVMAARGLRRLAVVDHRGALMGLMCLKRRGRGFCSDDDVGARAADAARG